MSEQGDAEQQIRQDRLAKLAAARSRRGRSVPDRLPAPSAGCGAAGAVGPARAGREDSGQRLCVAEDTVMARRGRGKAQFFDLVDASGRIQLTPRPTPPRGTRTSVTWTFGDLMSVKGEVLSSRGRGELSVRVGSWQLLADCPAAAAREVARADRRRAALSPPLRRPDHQRAVARRRGRAIARRLRDAGRAELDEEGFVEVGRAGAAAALRRRRGQAVHHPQQRRSSETSTCGSPTSST